MVKDEAEEGRILQYSQITTVEQFFRLTFKTNDQQPSIPKKHQQKKKKGIAVSAAYNIYAHFLPYQSRNGCAGCHAPYHQSEAVTL